MVRKLLIVFTVVLALILVSLFLPARQVSIEGVGTLSIGQEAAYASPDIEVDGTVSTGTGTGSTITVSHTTSGTNRLMLVGISGSYSSGSPVISGVTYNGVALSLVGSEAESNFKIWIYKLVAPATGTHDVVVSFSTLPDQGCVVGVETFTGVDQTTPLGTFASASANTGDTPTVDVSSATGELVFDTLWSYSGYTATVGAGQTQQWNTTCAPYTRGSGSTEAGASTVTMSWTISNSYHWAIGAVPIKPFAEVVSIEVSPETKNWGTVNPGQIYSSATEEFTLTNTGNVAVNTSIQGEDATASGAPNWVLSDTATPGSDIYGLKFSFNLSSWVVIQKSTVSFKADLDVGASDTFGLQLLTPTYISTPNKTYSAKIYITAVKA
jgi:hypothetical protein